MFDGFSALGVETDETTIFVRMGGGGGPALLLLHGFPETHVMWRGVAPILAHAYTVVCGPSRIRTQRLSGVGR
jgi:haloacetate dehalogenase